MRETRKLTAQFLNGLAVALLASAVASVLAGTQPVPVIFVAGLGSLTLHSVAIFVVRQR